MLGLGKSREANTAVRLTQEFSTQVEAVDMGDPSYLCGSL
jgi:hypothetical protein